MVIRGKTRGNGGQLASYLMRQGENDAVRILDIRGTAQPDNIHRSLLEMSMTSELSKTDKGLYHAQLNPAIGEDKIMTREDWLKAADIVEAELKLKGQKRVIVMHEKRGRLHAHVVWERYDHDKGRMIHDGKNFYAHDRARLAIEKELAQKQTPVRNAKRPEMKVELTELWYKTKTGEDFIKAAEEQGYKIAVSRERRPYRVIDEKGQDHDLLRQLDGVKVKEVREIFKDTKLPTKKEAITAQRSQKGQQGFNFAQEKFADHMDAFKSSHEIKQKEKQLFKSKLKEMKETGQEQTDRNKYISEKSLDAAQDRAAQKIKDFQQQTFVRKRGEMKEMSTELTKKETERERLKREFLESFDSTKQKSQEKHLDPELDL